MEQNKVELTGTVKQSWSVDIKSGVMAKILLTVGKHTFWILGFGNVGQALLSLSDGDEVGICGTCQINAWKTDDGNWRNDFQVVAWSVEINGVETAFKKPPDVAGAKNSSQSIPEYESRKNDGYDTVPDTPF